MAEYEATTTVDVAPNILFDYLADLEHLPEYLPRLADVHRTAPPPAQAQGMEARRPGEPVVEEVEVTAEVPAGSSGERREHSEAVIETVEEQRTLRWSAPDNSDYHGELDVAFVADGTSQLTVRLSTGHGADAAVDDELRRALEGIKVAVEQKAAPAADTPQA
jgi:uncharacterized protein YndB with AHSA1/START domain